jgi:hypothetical protein
MEINNSQIKFTLGYIKEEYITFLYLINLNNKDYLYTFY